MTNMLVYLHILMVEDIHTDIFTNQPMELLSQVKKRLPLHLLSIKPILTGLDPASPLPTSPAPLKLSHNDDFKRKLYGLDVIYTLREWLKEVLLVFQEAKNMCGSRG